MGREEARGVDNEGVRRFFFFLILILFYFKNEGVRRFCMLLDSVFLILEDIQELQPSSFIIHQFELLLEREFAKKMVKL